MRGRGRKHEQRKRQERLIEGAIQHHGRFAFLLSEEPGIEDLMLRGPTVRLAMDGDRVQARVVSEQGPRPVGEIVRVLKRSRSTITGVLRRAGSAWVAVPEEGDERDGIAVLGFRPGVSARDGDVVVVEITRWPTAQAAPAGEVREALGRPGQPGVRLKAILRTRGLPDSFPDEALAEARALPGDTPAAEAAGRERVDSPVFTIDGADAKDFDDAVSIERLDSGRLRLGVHIADVSHFVRPGSALDREGRARATSVYLPDRVIPMLPPKLSEDLCSLRPELTRLTVSCFIDFDAHGKPLSSRLAETAILSRRRFTYEEVQSLLEGLPVAGVDEPTRESLRLMGPLAKTLQRARERRGALDLSVPEYKVTVDAGGAPLEIVKRPRLDSHRLIEEFMLAANEAVARTLSAKKLPFVWRVHEDPDPKKLEALAEQAHALGIKSPGGFAKNPARALQELLRNAVGNPFEEMAHILTVRSLKQALYSSHPGGHFGLASKFYCHFTSPIRRYPDLLTHRAVRGLLRGGGQALEGGAALEAVAVHCSERERLAAEAERKAVDVLRAQLLARREGETLEGTVTHNAPFGCFVTLAGLGASALARGANAPLGAPVRVRLTGIDAGKGELTVELLGPIRRPGRA